MKARLASLVLLALALTSASFVGCGVTPGRPASATFAAVLAGGPTFRTAAGWDVTLSEASLAIGPVYVLAPTSRITSLERMRSLVLPVALAHGGFDDEAGLGVRLEWLESTVLTLGAQDALGGVAYGNVGECAHAIVELVPPTDASGPTHGHLAWLRGTATPVGGGETLEIEGGLDLPDDPLARRVESIAATFTVAETGRLSLTASVAPEAAGTAPSWLEDADFSRLPPPTTGTVRTIAPGTQPYVAWTLALRDALAYAMTYEPGAAR